MCGIFGTIGNVAPHMVDPLIRVNVTRGRDGFGVYLDGHVLKMPGHVEGAANMLREYVGNARINTIICNTRAEPTTEMVSNPVDADQQPYICGDWAIVHNGTIANDKDLIYAYDLSPNTQIDSWVIAGLLDTFSRTRDSTLHAAKVAFGHMLEVIVGSFAILAIHKPSDTMFYATNYRPLYWIGDDNIPFTGLSAVPLNDQWKLVNPYSWGYVHRDDGMIECDTLYNESPLRTYERTLVVLSGGLDSTCVAAKLVHDGHHVEALHFDYGCRARMQELRAVDNICDNLEIPLHIIGMQSLFREIGHSRLTGTHTDLIANGEAGAEQAIEWVPARNTIMAAVAMGHAEAHGFDNIALGINLEEADGGYTDNVLDLYDGLNKLSHWIVGVGKRVQFISPVGHLMKHEIVRAGLAVNAPFHLTWSCYNNGDHHCGNCGPCIMRKRAFARSGNNDPVFTT